MKKHLFCVLAGILFLVSAAGAAAATINVTNLNDSGPGSLPHAIANAASGDTIQVFLIGTITLTSGGLTIDKSLSIVGAGARLITIARGNAAPNFRIFTITSGLVLLLELTISNGRCGPNEFGGGGISVEPSAEVTVSYCTISGNDGNGFAGGGVANDGGIIALFNCTVSGNQANSGAGLDNNGGAGPAVMTVVNCTIAGNTAATTSTTAGRRGNPKLHRGPPCL